MARDPWWIIGSAAVALHGGDPGKIADIDVITSRRDLEALYQRLPLANTPDTSKKMFTSDLFGLWSEPALEVEFMTGLKLRVDDRWEPVEPQTRIAVKSDETTLHVPEKAELIAILQRFGREKDLQRAATLS
ncbi:hypothetical protein [Altererythrobacter lutimaris]|uniref:Nucleotidyl transferase AbiEii/AbiGii toxin family protein n=1 Tax=Altererythrobacter lutimaris TaxID=2743979 RepID=A0A850HAH0_9SPHN|nr:hypothetical protein [Altererythrobacter lutimaris]NVE94235.1 hypothetical protein [Altererythrobacter lutimaris]